MRAKAADTKPAAVRRRGNVTIRMRDEARAALQREAAARGRSLSEEIEARLERSLLEPRLAVDTLDAVYGPHLNAALLALGKVVKSVVEYQPFYLDRAVVGWLDYPWKFQQVVEAVNYFFERLRPAGAIETPRKIGMSVSPWINPKRKATPDQIDAMRHIHDRAGEIEATQAPHIGILVAQREIEKIISADANDVAPALAVRDEQIISRLVERCASVNQERESAMRGANSRRESPK